MSEEGGHSVGLWYVSFSDMITLLLSFFVMLTSFSSFSTDSMEKFSGACKAIAANSIFPYRDTPYSAVLPTPDRPIDFSEDGTEKPGEITADNTTNPKVISEIADRSAYSDKVTIVIPSDKLFRGKGIMFTEVGTANLKMIADFLKIAHYQVVVGLASSDSSSWAGGAGSDERIWAVLDYFQQAGISGDSLAVAPQKKSAAENSDRNCMEITLLAKGVAR